MKQKTETLAKIWFIIFGSLAVIFNLVNIVAETAVNIQAKRTIKPPPVEAVATVESPEIVTGVCTFGGCPVATTATTTTLPPITEAVKESLTTVNRTTEPATTHTDATETEIVAESATTEHETEPLTAEPVSETYTLTEPATESTEPAAIYSASYFRQMGVIYWGGWRWTWYSERVLPGTGLNIPGRHTSDGYVRDGDGYICLASDALGYGTVIETPFGSYGKVYDCGCDYDTIDVYVGW